MAKTYVDQPDLTALIMRATNPLNELEDPNLVQSICQEIGNDLSKVQLAMRLLIHKMQSPHEKEAMQALLVLQACVNNCGESFHSEIGKFRFLNEMIKLVSPKYAGNQTPYIVKTRVFELLYTWTIDLKHETKILEAYEMLKTQGVLKENPLYLGGQTPQSVKPLQPASFEDEQKSRLLQKLLQSRRPEDISKANALIKSMVKEDEQKLERTSRRIVEVETALNNVKVLDEMITQYKTSNSVNSADLDLMSELFSSCQNLRWNIYRTVSEMEDKDDGIGDFIKASGELSAVMGRYRLEVEGKSRCSNQSVRTQDSSSVPASFISQKKSEEDSLLDLSPDSHYVVSASFLDPLQSSGLASLNLNSSLPQPILKGEINIQPDKSTLGDLHSVFNTSEAATSVLNHSSISKLKFDLLTPDASAVPTSLSSLINVKTSDVKKITSSGNAAEKVPFNPLSEIDELGCELLKRSLPPNIPPVGPQFKPQDKVSLNDMKKGLKSSESFNKEISTTLNLSPLLGESLQKSSALQNRSSVVTENNVSSISSLITESTPRTTLISSSSGHVSGSSEQFPFTVLVSNGMSDCKVEKSTESLNNSDTELLSDLSLIQHESQNGMRDSQQQIHHNKRHINSNIQLSEVKPITDIKISLEDIKPGKQSSVSLIDADGISLVLHFTENKPREDVSIVVVSVTSKCSKPISDYMLQAVGPKGCKVKLQPPSTTELVEYSPFLPPPAITQIMLIANPNQLNLSLKVMLSYSINGEPVSSMGEMDNLPL